MLALWIVLGILFVILLVLFLPIRLSVSYQTILAVELRFLFFHFPKCKNVKDLCCNNEGTLFRCVPL